MPHAIVADGDLYYETAGSGPALLFITGLGGLAAFWRNQVHAFKDRYTVITYDHRGTGQSSRTDAPYSIAQMTADALALLDQLRVEQAVIVGHSTGGAIGLCLAANHAGRVQRLGLSATWTHCDPYFRRLFETRRQVLVHGDGLLYQKLSALMLFPPEWIARNDAAMREREAQAPLDPLDIRILIRRIDAITQHDGRDWARAVRCPTLIVVARDDTITPAYFSHDLARLIPHAALQVLQQGGHSAPVVEPHAYNTALSALLG